MKKKVLVVEDEEVLRELLRDVLEEAGFHVIVAGDGEEGLEKMYRESPDIILLDCQMPKMDGFEVLEKIRKDMMMINKPIIMLTVKSSESDQIRGISLGVDDYVTKPFNYQVLVAKIKTILERKEFSMSANPLTHLPGNLFIQREIERRLNNKIPSVFFYFDLSNFKSFNDYYGFQNGDLVIKHLAEILVRIFKKYNSYESFVGHVGGDDFVAICDPKIYKQVAEEIILEFDTSIINFYNEEDRKRGYILGKDRLGNEQKFPIMSLSIVAISTVGRNIEHYGKIGEIVSDLKNYAKKFNKSILVEERRMG